MRGDFTEEDRKALLGMKEVCPDGEQIFITGECDMEFLRAETIDGIMHWNSVLSDPLFTLTHRGTVKMYRHDWYSIVQYLFKGREKRLYELMGKEAERLGLVPMFGLHGHQRGADFYHELFVWSGFMGKILLSEESFDFMALNAFTLFGRKSYWDLPLRELLTKAWIDKDAVAVPDEDTTAVLEGLLVGDSLSRGEHLTFTEERYLFELWDKYFPSASSKAKILDFGKNRPK